MVFLKRLHIPQFATQAVSRHMRGVPEGPMTAGKENSRTVYNILLHSQTEQDPLNQ